MTIQVSAQNIGINETGANPHGSAILDVSSTNKGMLVPRLTTAQRTSIAGPANGLLVYDTNTSSFWFYDGGAWVELVSGTVNGNTLDEAYDEGGAGAGRTIIADAGPVAVQGGDGLLVTGTFASGQAIGNPGAGTRMFFNPRKAAFRAGNVSGNQWNGPNVGNYSAAFGRSNEASGESSLTAGNSNVASGQYSVALGTNNGSTGLGSVTIGQSNLANNDGAFASGRESNAAGVASVSLGEACNALGDFSVAMGNQSTTNGENSMGLGNSCLANGDDAVAIGRQTTANGNSSTAIGNSTFADAFNAFALGRYNEGGGNATTWVPTDPLFEIGNGSALTNRSNALTVLKNGNTGIGTSTPSARLHLNGTLRFEDGNEAAGRVLTTDAAGNASWADPPTSGGTLNDGYNFGGPGAGRIIVANSGFVGIFGTDGFAVGGTLNSGQAIGSPGSGVRLVFNPRKAAFRAGGIDSWQWNDINVGQYSTAFGQNTTASGDGSTAMGRETVASGLRSFSTGWNNTSSGDQAMTWGNSNTASGTNTTTWGQGNTSSGTLSTSWGAGSEASGNYSTAIGFLVIAPSFGETVIGRLNSEYTPVSATSWNANDRLFVVANGINTINRRNAMTILKNGNIGMGTDSPQSTLHVDGGFRYEDGQEAAGRALVSDNDGNATWSNGVGFYVRRLSNVTLTVGSLITFNNFQVLQGATFNLATGAFTAPAAGLYQFTYSEYSSVAAGADTGIEVYRNSTLAAILPQAQPVSSTSYANVITWLMQLNEGDVIQLELLGTDRTLIGSGNTLTSWQGVLVR